MVKAEGQRAAVVKHLRRIRIAKEEKRYFRTIRHQTHQRYRHIFIEAIRAYIVIAEVKIKQRAFLAHIVGIFSVKFRQSVFGCIGSIQSAAIGYSCRQIHIPAVA